MPALYVLATVWLWSLIPLAVKVAYQSFSFAFIAFSRLSVGACVFAGMELRAGRGLRFPPRRGEERLRGPAWMGLREWILVAGLGIAGDLLLYTLGLRYTTASAATLIVSTDGIILALLGVVVLRERSSRFKMGAGVTALTGLVLVGWNGQDWGTLLGSEYFVGNAVVLCAAFCWATYALAQRVLAARPGAGLFTIFLAGAAVAGLAALTERPVHAPLTWQALGGLAYLGLGGTGLAYILLTKGMARMEAATAGLLCSTLPLFTMAEAHLLIGERITPYLLGGAALIMAGVGLIMRHQKLYGG
jgi:drug/metabolite transporter (DMT)-like permease